MKKNGVRSKTTMNCPQKQGFHYNKNFGNHYFGGIEIAEE